MVMRVEDVTERPTLRVELAKYRLDLGRVDRSGRTGVRIMDKEAVVVGEAREHAHLDLAHRNLLRRSQRVADAVNGPHVIPCGRRWRPGACLGLRRVARTTSTRGDLIVQCTLLSASPESPPARQQSAADYTSRRH